MAMMENSPLQTDFGEPIKRLAALSLTIHLMIVAITTINVVSQ